MISPVMGQLVHVKWRDAFSDNGWTIIAEHPEDAVCFSVGTVVRMTELFLTIAPGIWQDSDERDSVGDPLSIPWVLVLDWWPLVRKEQDGHSNR